MKRNRNPYVQAQAAWLQDEDVRLTPTQISVGGCQNDEDGTTILLCIYRGHVPIAEIRLSAEQTREVERRLRSVRTFKPTREEEAITGANHGS